MKGEIEMGAAVFAVFAIPLVVILLYCAEQVTDFEEVVDKYNKEFRRTW